MKKIFKLKNYLLLAGLLVMGFASCKKDNNTGGINGTPGGTGAPTVTSVHTIEKNVVDSMLTSTSTVYNSSGIATTTTTPNYNPQVTAFDSTTVTGNLGNYYVLYGTNLGSTTKILINGISIYFNRALNSDKTVIFSIPTTVPYVQPQSNTIVLTTLYGTVTYKFTVLPPSPTITGVSDYDFQAGTQITLTGKGFASVTSVKLRTTGDAATIVSLNDSTLVMKMPAATTVTESTLLFTYTSGTNTGAQAASTAVFNDLDNGYIIFADNNYQNSWSANAWAGANISTAASHSGTSSFLTSYPAGGWQIEGWANYYPSFAFSAKYKYFTFWVKGGVAAHTIVLVGNQMAGGYNQVQNANAYAAQLVTVPPNVWTFFKIPLSPAQTSTDPSTLAFWQEGSPATQLGFFLQGMNGDVNETLYFDEVAFIQ